MSTGFSLIYVTNGEGSLYGKIFESIFDSTLAVEGDFITIYVFSSMIVLADEFGFINIGPDALYEKLKFPNDYTIKQEYLRSIDILEAPDVNSNLNAEEGRRIIPLREIKEIPENRGWWIVNYMHYRDKANQEDRKQARREYMTAYMSRRRSEQKKTNENSELKSCKHVLTPVNSCKQISSYTDTDTDTDTDTVNKKNKKPATRNKIPPSVEDVIEYCRQRENSIDPEKFINYYARVGWKTNNGRPIKDWQAAVRIWEGNEKKNKGYIPDTEGGEI